jgi:carboxymethylenebutenolidase
MKNFFTLILGISAFNFIQAQHSCCNISSANESFALLTLDQKFIDTHIDPQPFTLENKIGKDFTFKTNGGKDGHAYEIKSLTPTNNYVFVIHEWWGLNDYIKQEAEKIYKSLGNANVIAIDLYDNKVATIKDSAAKYMQQVKIERAENIIKGALNYVGKNAHVATIGWCFGGGWSLQCALLAGKQSSACIMYYGAPEESLEILKSLNAPVFFVWPEQDQWINKAMVNKFESNMKTLNKSIEIKTYNADHAFANPSNPKYNKAFAEDAFNLSISFIKKNLK